MKLKWMLFADFEPGISDSDADSDLFVLNQSYLYPVFGMGRNGLSFKIESDLKLNLYKRQKAGS